MYFIFTKYPLIKETILGRQMLIPFIHSLARNTANIEKNRFTKINIFFQGPLFIKRMFYIVIQFENFSYH